jgi:hypothetical protein
MNSLKISVPVLIFSSSPDSENREEEELKFASMLKSCNRKKTQRFADSSSGNEIKRKQS